MQNSISNKLTLDGTLIKVLEPKKGIKSKLLNI